eukprot:11110826-Prorocentrum_lima.AAC.1
MTSSLVGSEMCIRDRTLECQLGIEVDTTEVRVTSVRNPEKEQEVDSSTVSYTHLTLPTICSV